MHFTRPWPVRLFPGCHSVLYVFFILVHYYITHVLNIGVLFKAAIKCFFPMLSQITWCITEHFGSFFAFSIKGNGKNLYFISCSCDFLTPCGGHDVTGQRKTVGREWKAGVCSGLSSPPGFAVYGLPPQLLVASIDAVLELAHSPANHRAGHSQRHHGDSEGHQKTPWEPCRGTGDPVFTLITYVKAFM